MRPWWPMPVTIIPLEAAGVLGLLVCHPLGRLVAGAAGHPVVEVAAGVAHGEGSDVAPPTSPPRRPRQLRPRHVAGDPHHLGAAHERIHRKPPAPRRMLRPPAEPTSRADSGCRASNAVRPNAATAMRTIRLRPSLTTSLDRVCRPDYLPSRFARPVPIDEVE